MCDCQAAFFYSTRKYLILNAVCIYIILNLRQQQACPDVCITFKCPLETLPLCCGLFASLFSNVLCFGLCSAFSKCCACVVKLFVCPCLIACVSLSCSAVSSQGHRSILSSYISPPVVYLSLLFYQVRQKTGFHGNCAPGKNISKRTCLSTWLQSFTLTQKWLIRVWRSYWNIIMSLRRNWDH